MLVFVPRLKTRAVVCHSPSPCEMKFIGTRRRDSRLQGAATCPKCAAALAPPATACTKCGAELDRRGGPPAGRDSADSRKPAPVGISIALAFLLSFFFSPGQKFVTLFIDPTVLQSMASAKVTSAISIAGYWFPAAVIYVI